MGLLKIIFSLFAHSSKLFIWFLHPHYNQKCLDFLNLIISCEPHAANNVIVLIK